MSASIAATAVGESTIRKAQAQFNRWLDLPEAERRPARLMDMLGFDYFKLLDMLTIRQFKGADFSSLSITICGDTLHSRVARSALHALKTLGCTDIRVCGPDSLTATDADSAGFRKFRDFDEALAGVDAVMMLRLQRERMQQGLIGSLEDYFADYGLDTRRLALAKPDAIVMHPGPMNRGVEISDAVADGPQSVILDQVGNGVAVRMAVLQAVIGA